jgi:hypothetical protein
MVKQCQKETRYLPEPEPQLECNIEAIQCGDINDMTMRFMDACDAHPDFNGDGVSYNALRSIEKIPGRRLFAPESEWDVCSLPNTNAPYEGRPEFYDGKREGFQEGCIPTYAGDADKLVDGEANGEPYRCGLDAPPCC